MERLIGGLFENLSEPEWASAFLAGVCAETQSHAAAVLQVDVATRRQTLPAFFGQGADMAIAFEQTHASGNPWRPADESRGPPTGSVVVSDDVLPLARLRKTGFWSDFLRPMDVDHGGGVIGLRTASHVLSMTLLRSRQRGPYTPQERAWLGRLAPHWTNACRLRSRLAPADAAPWDAARAFDVMGTAAFLLDERGQCLRMNASAEAVLGDGTLVRLRGRRLAAAGPASGFAFVPATGTVVLRNPEGSAVGHASAHRLPGHGPMGAARTVVFVDAVRTARPADVRGALAALYGLTPREAELATHLADGISLADAAAGMGITDGAARTRLKIVFGKTGARNQGALIALIGSLEAVSGSPSSRSGDR